MDHVTIKIAPKGVVLVKEQAAAEYMNIPTTFKSPQCRYATDSDYIIGPKYCLKFALLMTGDAR